VSRIEYFPIRRLLDIQIFVNKKSSCRRESDNKRRFSASMEQKIVGSNPRRGESCWQ
jgi:hypothetical protein